MVDATDLVAVVVDSAASLPTDMGERTGLHIVPMQLTIEDRTYLDGRDIQPAAFYGALKKLKRMPTTSAPPPASFLEAFRSAADGGLNGILRYCDELLVSSDFKGNPHSCILDALSTMVMEVSMVKVLGWYDNEWGYSCRTADLCAFMADKGL